MLNPHHLFIMFLFLAYFRRTDNILEESQRKQRLDSVRIKFNKLYSSVIGPRYASLDQGGLVSGMIDSIACKVGLRGTRGTYV